MRYLDKDEILSKLGLETKTSIVEWLVSGIAPLCVGLVVGAGVALLFAPKSGRSLREDIRDKLRRESAFGTGHHDGDETARSYDPRQTAT